jgi:[ribosomal protein S18]-alanine N-acetyltransferase
MGRGMYSGELALKFLPMQAADIDVVIKNERRAYSHPWTEGIFRDCLASGNECWMLKVADRVVGHAILSMGAGESHLLNICVNPEFQGQGFGERLLVHIVERAGVNHCSCVFLEVRASNLTAYKLYERQGFTEIGIRKNYYPGHMGAEDALVLVKELILE